MSRNATRRGAVGVLLTSAITLPAAIAAAQCTPPLPSVDVQALHDEFRRLDAIAEADYSDDAAHDALVDAADAAMMRFVEAPVTTLWDVLLKLQLVDQMEGHSDWCAKHPDDLYMPPIIVVGLMRDLKALRAGRVQS